MHRPEVLSQFGIPNNFCSYSKKVCIFIDGLWPNREEFLNADFRVFIGGCEPYEIHKSVYLIEDLLEMSSEFDLILTSNDDVLLKCKNAVLFPFGTTWVQSDFKKISTDFEVSFLCGVKNYLPGHILRHEVYDNLHKVKCSGLLQKIVYTGIKTKHNIFTTSQYSIAIENTQHKNYFTEKIIDCFLTKTIPLYWGCPNIGDFFDTAGVIKINDCDDLIRKANLLTPDHYEKKKDVIEANFIEAQKYKDFFSRVNQEIERHIND